MSEHSYTRLTTSRFDRDAKGLAKRNRQMIPQLERAIQTLERDPLNTSGEHKIKKLRGIKKGEGQWRIAFGEYRIRYDVFGREVVLYSCKARREVYRG